MRYYERIALLEPVGRAQNGHRRYTQHDIAWIGLLKGAPASHGVYDPPIQWTMTAAHVIAGGVNNYCDSVRTWAGSVYEELKASGKN